MIPRTPQPAERVRQASPVLRTCTAVLAFAPFFSMYAQAAKGADQPHLARVQAILDAPDLSDALPRLQAMGVGAVPAVWMLLSGQDGLDETYDLLPNKRDLLLQVVAKWPKAQVVKSLMSSLTEETELSDRLVLIELIAATNSGNAIPAIVRALDGVDPIFLQSTTVARSLQNSLGRLIREDPSQLGILRRTLSSVPDDLLPILLELVSELNSQESLTVLADIVQRAPGLRQPALRHIAGLRGILLPPSAQVFIEMARRDLRAEEPIRRRVAVQVLGSLQDGHSFVAIVESLQDEDPVVRRLAQSTLESISGLHKRWGVEQWLNWFDAEQDWLDSTDKLASALTGEDLYRAASAVRELSEHTLAPETVNDLLAEGLNHDHPRIRKMTCEGLVNSAHVSAVGYLIGALLDEDAGVRAAARASLTQLSGQDFGAESAAWRTWWKTLW